MSAFEQFKHLDALLSDSGWMREPCESRDGSDVRLTLLFDLWQAVRTEALSNLQSRTDDLVRAVEGYCRIGEKLATVNHEEGEAFDALYDALAAYKEAKGAVHHAAR